MGRRIARGRYYADAHMRRENGKRFGVEVARQAPTLRAACAALTASGLPGHVQVWSDVTQQRHLVAERDEAGNWWLRNPYTGNLDPFEPEHVTR